MLTANQVTFDYANTQFKGYLDPMDRGAQGLIIDYLGNPKIAGGICLMLSINWIIESVGTAGPAAAWQTMKSHGPVYFKQIGQQQQGYQNDITKLTGGGAKATVRECVQLASRNARDVARTIDAGDVNAYAAAVGQGLAGSSTVPPTSLLLFWFAEGGGHAVAAAHKDGLTYLYDPNFGVLKVDPKTGSIDDLITKLFAAYKHFNLTLSTGFVAQIS